MKCFLTGATGFIGSWLADRIASEGGELFCLVRPGSNRRWLNGLNIELCEGDLFDQEALAQGLENADYVLHAAGAIKTLSKRDYYKVNIEGTRSLLEAIRKSPTKPKRFLYISSQAAVGPSPSREMLDESCLPSPISHYGKSKLGAEGVVRSFSGICPYTIMRPSVVYGPRDTGMLPIFKSAAHGFAFSIGRCEPSFSVIHVADLVNMIMKALKAPQAENKIYFAASSEICTPALMYDALEAALGRTLWRIRVPALMAGFAALLAEGLGHVAGRPQIMNRDKLLEASQSYWLVSDKLISSELEVSAELPLKEGLRLLLLWYQENGYC